MGFMDTETSSTTPRPANSPIAPVQKAPPLSDSAIQTHFKALQDYLKTAQDKSPKAVYNFLKTRGLAKNQIKSFIQKASMKAYDMTNPESYEQKQKKLALFQKLPKWAQWGMSYAGINPSDTSKIS